MASQVLKTSTSHRDGTICAGEEPLGCAQLELVHFHDGIAMSTSLDNVTNLHRDPRSLRTMRLRKKSLHDHCV